MKLNGKVNGAVPKALPLTPIRSPRLSEEFEAQLRPLEDQITVSRARVTDLTEKIDQLAQRIREDDSVVVSTIDDNDSIVTCIDEIAKELNQVIDSAVPVTTEREETTELQRPPRASTH